MFPTPDPSASLTPWQVYVVARDDTFAQMAITGAAVFVVAAAMLLFLVAALTVIAGYRRG